jgi:HPt (histidine-containing phosphotransfer) domain-containing protein
MAGEFLDALPGRLVEIHRLQAADQWEELNRAAHALKGLVAMFGLQPLADTFRSLEQAAAAADRQRVQSLVASLDQQLMIATQQLRVWLQSQSASLIA